MNPLILIGSAPCTKADFQNAVVIVETADVIGIGLDSADKCNEKFLGVVTYEPHDLPRFYQKRELMGFHEHCPSYSQEQFKGFVNHVYPELEPPQPDSQGWSGSSALLGVKVGLRLGYKKIILCGCPLDVHRYKKFHQQPF